MTGFAFAVPVARSSAAMPVRNSLFIMVFLCQYETITVGKLVAFHIIVDIAQG